MVRVERIHRDNNRLPLWLAPFKKATNPRNLIILIPVLISLIFGGMFSMGRQDAYEDQQRQHTTSSKATQSQDSPSAKTALPTIVTPESTPNSSANSPAPDTTSPTTSPSSQASSSAAVAIPPSLVQTLKPGLTPVCNTAAKTLAYTKEQTALTAENTYHTSQMVLALLSGNQDAENARHDAAVAQIKATYSDSLELASCLD